jgi:hypothetical protein
MLACISLVASSLAGCNTTRESRIGVDDGTDSCRAYVVALDSTGNYFAADMIQGAVAGAAAGALLGGLAGGSFKGAAIGAAAGMMAGMLGGYWKNQMQQGMDQAILHVSADMRRENAQLDKTNAAFRQLADCRRGQAREIKAEYRAKAITRDDAKARLTIVAARAHKDLEIANAINANAGKRLHEYQYAAAQIDPNVPAPTDNSANGSTDTDTAKPQKAVRHTHKAASAAAPETTQEFNSNQAKVTDQKSLISNYASDMDSNHLEGSLSS